ncbi:MAG: ABC transporter substrate-binding protein [Alkalispirochaeta sp.]
MMIEIYTTLHDLTERYPETITVLVDAGFRKMVDPEMRRRFGSSVTVETAALARGLDPASFLRDLRRTAGIDTGTENGDVPDGGDRTGSGVGSVPGTASADESAGTAGAVSPAVDPGTPVRIVGLVPCPIRVPMTNVLESASTEFTARTGISVEYDLQAAYTGTEWIEENIGATPRATDLPEIFLSAGFRLFFTDERFRRLRREGAFADRSGWNGTNGFATSNALIDPEHSFSVIGVVPAVFMVNRNYLGSRAMPETWADVLSPAFENGLALPIGDFDLFDSLLLGVHRNFGIEGIRSLARNMYQEMHPAQMVAGASRSTSPVASGGDQGAAAAGLTGTDTPAGPVITIMPYFFTRTINETSPLVPVWPSDGALAAPILLVTRRDRPEIQPMIDTIAGLSMSRVLSRLGLFPSAHPENDDFDADEHPLQWPGWDLLLSPELPQILADTTAEFQWVVQNRHLVSVAGGPA